MPSISPNDTVLVTCASGFIAVWVCHHLLEAGYKVRGTVRSTSKGDYLVELFKSYGPKFKYVIVEDIGKESAFDEAVKGVHGVAHTASPFNFVSEDPKDLIDPAVKGTIGILESVKKYGSDVKRVLATSSIASVTDGMYHLKIPGTVYTESDWNTFSIKEIEEKGKDASGIDKYCASKTLAEKAAWEFVEKTKPNWDLATCCPSMIFGPIIHQVSNPSALNTSIATLYNFIYNKESITEEKLLTPNWNFADVRDIGLAHVRALEVEEAGGQRFIASSSPYCWQDALDALDLPPDFPCGTPGSGKRLNHIVFSHAKANKILGIQFKSFQDCVRDTVESLEKHGWGVVV
ncbi:Putative NADPH-dependent methylglyoxal reductase GRP2 OS=Candida albicans (strain SC5314 / ATCC MYA-2876) GN=GRP2 PE=1 SV=2 [Rhizoctonia solani AG-1 IB]|uniref:Putative NADPH-dependent methylglyoxal reductase GRP2 n=1 Tax=Thanatephorus cucumeris (strain AG1-IB / isolate 7/3/14) TaxID=1108050 RepID=A0A0B7FAD2_THACB|nr:Putative NADPH-dependent methylglyoxal reductase GRP2 OS=Candida albicans (strain SC5314 / ATCC MYA-2876) GN=GRP2 PE=1 SV=2 [Rhizoctonia solani AG-1 IB]